MFSLFKNKERTTQHNLKKAKVISKTTSGSQSNLDDKLVVGYFAGQFISGECKPNIDASGRNLNFKIGEIKNIRNVDKKFVGRYSIYYCFPASDFKTEANSFIEAETELIKAFNHFLNCINS